LRLLTFKHKGLRAGALIGDIVLDINSAQPFLPSQMEDILNRGLLPEVQNLVDNASEIDRSHFRQSSEVQLYAPVPRPGKIICLGLNYRGHAEEQKREPPDHPMLFSKAPTSLAGPYEDILIRPGVDDVDAEAELAVVIGRIGTMIDPSEAGDYIAGYTAFNDVSARRIQREDRQWFRSKSFDTFAPCGPWLVTPDEVVDPQSLPIAQYLNDFTMQKSNTSEMIFPISDIIAFVSGAMTLMPGDIIATGTPEGVGLFRDPPVFLKEEDTVVVEIGGIGRLKNRVSSFER